MASGTKRLNGPRCSGKTKTGKPCQALAGSDGLCSAHSGRQNMRELGRRGGRGRSRARAERVHPNLREYLRAEVHPSEVWAALKLALEGQNEAARVSASRVLMDALHEPERESSSYDMQQAAVDARAHIEAALRRTAAVRQAAGESELAELLRQSARELWSPGEQAVTSSGVIVGDVTAEEAKDTLRQLAEAGLIAPPDAAGELTRLRADVERLEQQLARIPASVREEFLVT